MPTVEMNCQKNLKKIIKKFLAISHNVPRLSDVPKDENEVFRFRNVAKRQISAVARCAPRARVQQRVARHVAQNARRILRNVRVYLKFSSRLNGTKFGKQSTLFNRTPPKSSSYKGMKIWAEENWHSLRI